MKETRRMSIRKKNRTLGSLRDWQEHAGPKSRHHWVDDRSAKELARAWLASSEKLPQEVAAVLMGHARFGAVIKWQAEPEAKLRFDDFPGEPSNSDLVVHAWDAAGPYLIAIEAKADESYGKTVVRIIEAAEARRQVNPRSNGLNRVQHLMEFFFGARAFAGGCFQGIRYQLLTASAGALCEAQRLGYSRTVLLIQEFVTNKTKDENHVRNSQDLQNFMRALNPENSSVVTTGKLFGPFAVPGDKFMNNQPEFYIGKVTRNLRTTGA